MSDALAAILATVAETLQEHTAKRVEMCIFITLSRICSRAIPVKGIFLNLFSVAYDEPHVLDVLMERKRHTYPALFGALLRTRADDVGSRRDGLRILRRLILKDMEDVVHHAGGMAIEFIVQSLVAGKKESELVLQAAKLATILMSGCRTWTPAYTVKRFYRFGIGDFLSPVLLHHADEGNGEVVKQVMRTMRMMSVCGETSSVVVRKMGETLCHILSKGLGADVDQDVWRTVKHMVVDADDLSILLYDANLRLHLLADVDAVVEVRDYFEVIVEMIQSRHWKAATNADRSLRSFPSFPFDLVVKATSTSNSDFKSILPVLYVLIRHLCFDYHSHYRLLRLNIDGRLMVWLPSLQESELVWRALSELYTPRPGLGPLQRPDIPDLTVDVADPAVACASFTALTRLVKCDASNVVTLIKAGVMGLAGKALDHDPDNLTKLVAPCSALLLVKALVEHGDEEAAKSVVEDPLYEKVVAVVDKNEIHHDKITAMCLDVLHVLCNHAIGLREDMWNRAWALVGDTSLSNACRLSAARLLFRLVGKRADLIDKIREEGAVQCIGDLVTQALRVDDDLMDRELAENVKDAARILFNKRKMSQALEMCGFAAIDNA